MNKTVRESKFKSKIHDKSNNKPLLPNIEAFNTKNTEILNKTLYKKNLMVQTLINENKLEKQSVKKFQNQQTKQSIARQPNNFNLLAQNIKAHIHSSGHKRGIPQLNNEIQTVSNIMNRTNRINFHQVRDINSPSDFQMWNLNHHLKQFNQTKQVEFYKNQNNLRENVLIKRQEKKIAKNRTQQLRPMYKIYATENISSKTKNPQKQKNLDYLKKLYDPKQTLRQKIKNIKNKSFSNNSSPFEKSLYGTLPARKLSSNNHLQKNQKTLNKRSEKTFSESKFPLKDLQDINPYLKTFINGSHLKREKSNQNIQIIQIENTNQQNQKKIYNNFRKNRFQKRDKKQQIYLNNSSNQLDYIQNNQNNNKIQDINTIQPESLFINCDKKYQNMFILQKGILEKKLQQKQKLYQFNKSINKINKTLLTSLDDYLDYQNYSTMPISSIQFYIDSLTQFQFSKNENINNRNKKERQQKQIYGVAYDFSFNQSEFQPLQIQNKKKI